MNNNLKDWPYNGSTLIKKDEIKFFLKRDNKSGLIHLFFHLLLIFITAYFIYFFRGSVIQYLFMFIEGVFIAFLYAGMHECIHKTAFKSRKLNEFIGKIIGFFIFRSFLNARYRHMAHHTYTQHPKKDPDRVEFPNSYFNYFKHITSIAILIRIFNNLIRHSLGIIKDSEKKYIPTSEINNLIKETRIMFLGYFCFILISIIFSTNFFLIYWVIPRFIGEPVLRLVRMVEHTGKEETADMINNTRTSFPSSFLRFLYWNMPFHIEHHLYANVPFYKLPKFHKIIKPHTPKTDPSIIRVHFEILKLIWINKKRKNKNNLLEI